MKKFNKVRATFKPKEIEITSSQVFIASNIQHYEETIDGHFEEGYEYDYTVYGKDEYITYLSEQNQQL